MPPALQQYLPALTFFTHPAATELLSGDGAQAKGLLLLLLLQHSYSAAAPAPVIHLQCCCCYSFYFFIIATSVPPFLRPPRAGPADWMSRSFLGKMKWRLKGQLLFGFRLEIGQMLSTQFCHEKTFIFGFKNRKLGKLGFGCNHNLFTYTRHQRSRHQTFYMFPY